MPQRPDQKQALYLWLLFFLLCLSIGIGLTLGSSSISPALLFHNPALILEVRLPHVVLAAFAGAGLAVAGAVFQALLGNPLADPYIVGISGGAALGGVLAMVLGATAAYWLPGAAFLGAVCSTLLLFAMARRSQQTSGLTLLLIGVVFNAFAAAVITFIKTVITPTEAQTILFWLMGVITVQMPLTLEILAVHMLIGYAILHFGRHALDLLAMGDSDAKALGLNLNQSRLLLFAGAALLVGSVVAVAGMIGFVGLIVPHILRRIGGADHRWLLPACALGGASFLILADTLTRLSFFWWGRTIPVGVVTAFTGGPFFLWLLLRSERR